MNYKIRKYNTIIIAYLIVFFFWYNILIRLRRVLYWSSFNKNKIANNVGVFFSAGCVPAVLEWLNTFIFVRFFFFFTQFAIVLRH